MNQTNQDALDKLQKQLERKFNITDDTEKQVLTDDLVDAMNEVLNYCNREVLIDSMITFVKSLYLVNRNFEGIEGEAARSEGGVSQTFETGIPKKIQVGLNRYRVATVRSFP